MKPFYLGQAVDDLQSGEPVGGEEVQKCQAFGAVWSGVIMHPDGIGGRALSPGHRREMCSVGAVSRPAHTRHHQHP